MSAWLTAHALHIAACLALLTLASRAALAVARALALPSRRWVAVVEMIAAASPDLVRMVAKGYEALTGRALPGAALLLALLRPTPASSAPADAPHQCATAVPGDRPPGDEMTRAGRLRGPGGTLGAMCLALLSFGCAGGPGGVEAAALKAGVTVLEGAAAVRRYVCSRALDPLLGDPRPAEASTAPSSGGQAPAPPPAPAPSSPPATPPPQAPTPPAPRLEGDAGPGPDDAGSPAEDGGA